MSCSPIDLRDYLLEEAPEAARRQVEAHLKTCQGCREEYERLRLTTVALHALPDEEPPRRIAFVSDKVFEPSAVRRWWNSFWASGARLGFASAAMLSTALLVLAFTRTQPAPAPVPSSAGFQTAAVQEEIDRRVTAAVATAVADLEAKQAKQTAAMLAVVEKRNESERQALLLAFEKNFEYMSKRLNRFTIASAGYGPPRTEDGEAK